MGIELIKKTSGLNLTAPSVGGMEEVFVGTEQPDTKTIKLWIDTDAESYYYTKTEVDKKIDAIPEPDLSGYALKTEIPSLNGYAKTSDIPDVSKFITEIPAEYVTETELNKKQLVSEAYLGSYVSGRLSNYAHKTDIPDVSGFIKEIPTEYITDTELNSKGYLTEHQSLEGYAKTSDIPDVSGFALKSELPNTEGLATEQYVNTLVGDIGTLLDDINGEVI